MNSSKIRPGSMRRPVGEAPVEKIVTEAELRVKQLLEAQMESSVTVTSLQARYKQFAPAVLYDPQLGAISGARSLSSYSTAVDGDQQLDELRQLGLSEDDIRAIRAGDSSESASVRRHLLNPDVAREQIERIREHVASRSRSVLEDGASRAPSAFSGAATVSRHTLQLERALGRGTRLATMTECLLREKRQQQSSIAGSHISSFSSPVATTAAAAAAVGSSSLAGGPVSSAITLAPHPSDILRQIAEELSGAKGSNTGGSNSRKKRRRKSPPKHCDAPACDTSEHDCSSPTIDRGRLTLSEQVVSERAKECCSPPLAADMQSPNTLAPAQDPAVGLPTLPPKRGTSRTASAAYTYGPSDDSRACDAAAANDSTPDVGQACTMKPVCGPMWLITDEEIERNRLCVSELRALPHFAAYEPGTPTNVLYVKNLASSVRELDLVSLFNRFSSPAKPKIIYRLLVGRMKGQAFVTLPDVETATLALHTLNGYVFRGKPVVLSYGRKVNADASLPPGQLAAAASTDQEPNV